QLAVGADGIDRHAGHRRHDCTGHVHAGRVAAHVDQRWERPDRADAGENAAALLDTELADLLHPAREDGHVEDELRLAELGAGGDILAETLGAPLQWRRKRVFDRADEPVGCRLVIVPDMLLAMLETGTRGMSLLSRVMITT